MKRIEFAHPVRTFRPLSEEAYDMLRAAILGGHLAPGVRIVEADAARQMAISRSPVREAVRKLEQEGLVEYVPRRGTIVVGPTSAANLAQLLEWIERMRACAAGGDLDGLLAADVELHRTLADLDGVAVRSGA